MTTTQAVKCRRLAGPLLERPFYGRDCCDEKKIEKLPKKQKLTGSSPQTLQLRPSLAGPPGRRSAPDFAHRHQLVCRQVASFFDFGSVLLNDPYNSPCGCEGI